MQFKENKLLSVLTQSLLLASSGLLSVGYRATANEAGEPSLLQPILLMILGTLLLWLALRNWRKPVSKNKEDPRFFSIVDKITPPKAFGFGAMISVVNFKNLTLFLTA